MREDAFILILDQLRHVQSAIEAGREEVRDLRHRVASLEVQVSGLHRQMGRLHLDLAHVSERLDRLAESR